MVSSAWLHRSLSECLGSPTKLMTAYQVLTMPARWVMGYAVDERCLGQLHQEVVVLYDAHRGGIYDLDMGHAFDARRVWKMGDGGYITTRGVGLWDSSIDWHVLQEFGVIRFFTPLEPLVHYYPLSPQTRALTELERLSRTWLQASR